MTRPGAQASIPARAEVDAMRRQTVQRLVALSMLALLAQPGLARVSAPAPRRIAKDVLADKVRGGWTVR